MVIFLAGLQLIGFRGYSQWKSFIISPKGDTLNVVDQQDKKQGRWVNHFDEVRGEDCSSKAGKRVPGDCTAWAGT